MRPLFTVITDRSVLAFGLKPNRSVESQAESSLFPRRNWFSFAVNNRFRNYRVRDSLQHEVRNEESCRFILSGRRAALLL